MRSVLIVISILLTAAVVRAQPGSYEVVEVNKGGRVAGRVIFSGNPPAPSRIPVDLNAEVCGKEDRVSTDLMVGAGGGVRYAVVNLAGVRRGKSWKTGEYNLGQAGCRFDPHILLMREGADLHILNTDRIPHGVRTYGQNNQSFNIGQPRFVESLLVEQFTDKLRGEKVARIGCDFHSWMRAYVVLQDHPYYVVTDESGSFEITEVPPGDYTLELWHETLGASKQEITVKPGAETAVTFKLSR